MACDMCCRNRAQYCGIFNAYGERSLGDGTFTTNEIAGAIDFVRELDAARGGLLACPVSRLQVRFRLGYRRACALASLRPAACAVRGLNNCYNEIFDN
jgi:hypothetical protein